MKVFDSNKNHVLKFVPRFYNLPTLLELKSEFDNEKVSSSLISTTEVNGYYELSFSYTFKNKDKGEIIIKSNEDIIYRGSYIVTNQNTQNFKLNTDTYTYYEGEYTTN
jgi:hypothetical protein